MQVSSVMSCRTGKWRFESKESAKRSLKQMIRAGYSRTGKPNAYRCEVCGWFHIGNKKPWLKKPQEDQMNPEIKAQMNDLAYRMKTLADEFNLSSSADAQFCRRVITGAFATMEMKLENQWGAEGKLKPEPLESEAPAAPKKAK
jgi:hypothetical protein